MTAPSKKDRSRPVELIVMSAIVAVFVAVVVFASTRQLELGAIFGGIGFIVALLTFAMLALYAKPDGAERFDIDEQNRIAGPPDPSGPERPRGH